MDIESFLKDHGIDFQRFDHPAVFTCEESKSLNLDLPGIHTKNLFLRDEKGTRFFLVTVDCDKRVDLKELKKVLGTQKLSFASPEKLKEYLGVEPGSLTLLGLIYDRDHQVEVFLDASIFEATYVQCHPLINTATVVLSHDGLETFFRETEHEVQVIHV